MKLISLFLFICFAQSLIGQGNLQFNQALTFENTGTWQAGVADYSSPIYTVPNGKVWRIEYINLRRTWTHNPQQAQLIINGKVIYDNLGETPDLSGGMVNSELKCPFWLGASSTIRANFTGGNQNVFYQGSYFFSIIEFNIVP